MTQWSTTTKHDPSSINNGNKYELKDRVSIEQLNNMTENAFYAMQASSEAKEKAEEALSFAQGSGTTVFENGSPVAQFNADKKANKTDLNEFYTKQEVDDKISNLDVDVDFSDYYNKSETNDLLDKKADKSEIPTTYIKEILLKTENGLEMTIFRNVGGSSSIYFPDVPTEFIKKATVVDNLLILTNQDDENVTFGGGSSGQIVLRRWS